MVNQFLTSPYKLVEGAICGTSFKIVSFFFFLSAYSYITGRKCPTPPISGGELVDYSSFYLYRICGPLRRFHINATILGTNLPVTSPCTIVITTNLFLMT